MLQMKATYFLSEELRAVDWIDGNQDGCVTSLPTMTLSKQFSNLQLTIKDMDSTAYDSPHRPCGPRSCIQA